MKIKHTLFFLLIIGLLPACRKDVQGKKEAKKAHKRVSQVAQNESPDFSMEGFQTTAADFGENVADFFADEAVALKEGTEDLKDGVVSWVSNDDLQQEAFPVVYFDFDKFDIRADQESAVEQLALQIKDVLDEAASQEKEVTIVARGHASPEKGSRKYNMLLSEKRAVALASELEKLGITRDAVKVVGCGQEEPVVTGQEQHLNRRVEIRVISA